MAAPIRPAATKAFQREKVFILATAADINAIKITEMVAATTLDLSCILFDDFTRPTQTTNRVTLDRRVCDGAQYEQIGVTNYQGGDFWYAFAAQSASGSDGKKAFERLPEGTTGILVKRLGISVQTDAAIGQFYDAFPVEFGPPFPMKHGDGETAEVGIMQGYAITGPPAIEKAFVA